MYLCFFVFKQKTAYDLRTRDWSSDGCSSDLGFIFGNPNQHASARRLEGYRAALEERGAKVDDALIAQGLFTYRSGLDAAEILLARDPPPTAIFASNDDMASAAVAVATITDESRVGKECVRTCRTRCAPYLSKKNKNHTY